MAPTQKIAYDDYYDDDGYGEEPTVGEQELSPEDQAQMRSATEEVEKALGTAVGKVTTAQIQEALWYYYYDIDKSIAYLIRKFVDPPAPNEKKAKGQKLHTGGMSTSLAKSRPFAATRATEGDPGGHFPAPNLRVGGMHGTSIAATEGWCSTQRTKQRDLRSVPASFWNDMPWFNIPRDRATIFIESYVPNDGLLGGGMSRLQSLAAGRKKKTEDKKVAAVAKGVERLEISTNGISEDPDISRERIKENINPTKHPEKRRKLTRDAESDSCKKIAAKVATIDLKDSIPAPTVSQEPIILPEPAVSLELAVPRQLEEATRFGENDDYRDVTVDDLIKEPSDFASTLFGSPSPPQRHKRSLITRYPVPYAAFCANVADAFSGPSPDDEVLQAQAKAQKKVAPAAAKKEPKKEAKPSSAQLTGDARNLKIPETGRLNKPRVDVLKEYENSPKKKSATFVVVGHVDAGKSTLMGRLLLDLKKVEERTVNKYRKDADTMGKSSFALAWVFDQRSEERARGITIDISRNSFQTETTLFTILDAPGHQDFVPNMIAGASQADFAVLVIDASTGAFESGLKGQTKEHALLIRSMGVARIIVAVNKLDTVGWSKDRYDEISQQVSGFLASTGFQMKNVSFVPMSGISGDNVAKHSTEPEAAWYTGPTLVEELERSEPTAKALTKPLRMSISEVYRTSRSPVTVSGRIEAGYLQTGDTVLVQPSGEQATLKSLQADEADSEWAVAGQNVALHLVGIDAIHVRPGDIVCDPLKPVQNADEFTVKALAFDVLMPDKIDIHRGRLQGAGRIVELVALLDKATGNVVKKRPRTVKPGAVARIVVRMQQKIPLEAGQRVVLRSGGETVAAGLLE